MTGSARSPNAADEPETSSTARPARQRRCGLPGIEVAVCPRPWAFTSLRGLRYTAILFQRCICNDAEQALVVHLPRNKRYGGTEGDVTRQLSTIRLRCA